MLRAQALLFEEISTRLLRCADRTYFRVAFSSFGAVASPCKMPSSILTAPMGPVYEGR
jgi:hypothetical protein